MKTLSREVSQEEILGELLDEMFHPWLCKRRSDGPLILFSGPMGVGKTHCVKWICKQLGLKGSSSPSFSIIQTYDGGDFEFHHVDLYRLKNQEDLESTGFWDLFQRKTDWIVVEWPDQLNLSELPLDRDRVLVQMSFSTKGEQARVLNFRVLEECEDWGSIF